jgi:hypothetical protein
MPLIIEQMPTIKYAIDVVKSIYYCINWLIKLLWILIYNKMIIYYKTIQLKIIKYNIYILLFILLFNQEII